MGNITDGNGDPIPNIEMIITNVEGTHSYGSSSWKTNELGDYILNGNWVDRDSFKVCTKDRTGYINEYFDNVTNIDDAEVLYTQYPDTLRNIDFILNLGGVIEGMITDTAGDPANGVQVRAYKTDSSWSYYTYTKSDGSYQIIGVNTFFYNVCAGEYDSLYTISWYDNKQSQQTADSVYVTINDTVSDIDLVVKRGGHISGHIYGSDSLPIEDILVIIHDANIGDQSSFGLSDTNGYYYSFYAMPQGNYKLLTEAQYSRTNAGQWYNDVLSWDDAQEVTVIPNQTTPDIDFYLHNGGYISGKITEGSYSLPFDNAIIRKYQYLNPYYGWQQMWYEHTDSTGYYCIPNLCPIDYKILANPVGYDALWYDNKSNINEADILTGIVGDTITDINFHLEVAGILNKDNFEQTDIIDNFRENYSNPFSSSRSISYTLSLSAYVKIAVYDIQGRLIDVVISEKQQAGNHTIMWNGKHNDENALSGLYFIRISANETILNKSVIILR